VLTGTSGRYIEAYVQLRRYERELEYIVPSSDKRKQLRAVTLPLSSLELKR
jgi:hypothetical protein